MPDITMCHGRLCPLKDTCHRHTAKAGPYQSWFGETPGIYYERPGRGQTWGCHFYISTTSTASTADEATDAQP